MVNIDDYIDPYDEEEDLLDNDKDKDEQGGIAYWWKVYHPDRGDDFRESYPNDNESKEMWTALIILSNGPEFYSVKFFIECPVCERRGLILNHSLKTATRNERSCIECIHCGTKWDRTTPMSVLMDVGLDKNENLIKALKGVKFL